MRIFVLSRGGYWLSRSDQEACFGSSYRQESWFANRGLTRDRALPGGRGQLVRPTKICGATARQWHTDSATCPLYENRKETVTISDRDSVAGFRYGLEGMRVGGQRRYQASPHLCYGEAGVSGIVPPNAVLVFDVKVVAIEEQEAPDCSN